MPDFSAIEKEPVEQALMTAPVIYIDGVQGFSANPQLVKLNLYQDRMTSGPGVDFPFKRIIEARLVISTANFLAIADWLSERAADVRKAMSETEKVGGK